MQVGRFGYTSGAEGVSGVAKIEAVKRVRVDSRLVGEFEFSFFQRSFDGARADYARRRARATAAVKLAVSVGGALERTVHIHAKKALKAGASPNALRQVALIALPTIGLPRAMDAVHRLIFPITGNFVPMRAAVGHDPCVDQRKALAPLPT